MQDKMMMPFIHANERFKRVRKLVVTEMRPAAVTEYFHPVQKVEIHRLVNSLITDPKEWKSYIARAIASIVSADTARFVCHNRNKWTISQIMTTVYDRPIKSGTEAEQVVKNVVRLKRTTRRGY